jgi:endonuclease/exonuclease/phosphatase family metal-dependent hydrolase
VSATVKLISWNTNARRNTAAQARALLARRPDIIALQEVTAHSVNDWVAALRDGGLPQVQSTLTSSELGRGPHAYGVLIASHYPLGDQAGVSFPVPAWQEKVLSLHLDTPLGKLAMHTVHVPNGSANGWAKIEVLEAVFAGVSACCAGRDTLLCGDFNTPQCELASGEIVTWAQDVDESGRTQVARRILGGSGLRWDAGERNILSGLQPFGMRDVFRSLHGYEVDACSWIVRRKDLVRRRRFDHVLASARLQTISCEYLTEWLDERLSDHAAIEAVFEA